jgi:4-amino-4-deoxy-L-arabinose transferase-like glycosyltransferase
VLRDRWRLAFAALVVLDFVWIAPRLAVADLNLDYPFVDGDSWDWIANGLAYAGHPVRFSGRPPLVPWLLALLERLGAMPLFPVLVQLLVHGTALAFFGVAARLHGAPVAFVTGVALLFNHSYQSLALDLMADVTTSCLLFAAAAAFLAAAERPRAYAVSGLLGVLSALTQQAALLLPLPAAAVVLLHRRRDLRAPWLWAGAALFAAPLAAWLLWQRAALGLAGQQHWRLLRLHDGGSAAYYLWALASLLGLPGLVLLAAGLVGGVWRGLRREPQAAAHLFLAALTAALVLFFTFAYDFHAKRFLAYGYWVGGLLIAAALARLRRAGVRRTAAALLVAGSLLPLPAPGRDPSWIGLWPLPTVYARVGLVPAPAGSAEIDLSSVSIVRLPLAEIARASNLSRVLEVGDAAAAPRLDPARLAGDRGALFLYGPAEEAERYRTTTRLGNALRRQLGFVPASWLEPYLGLVEAVPLGRVAEAAVYRADVRGLSGTWLLLATSGSPWADRFAAPRVLAAPDRDLRRRMERGRRRARAVAAYVAGSDAYVALLPGPETELARLYLPFLLDPAELRIVEPAQEAGARAFLAGLPVREKRRFGDLLVRKIEVFGRPSAVVQPGG